MVAADDILRLAPVPMSEHGGRNAKQRPTIGTLVTRLKAAGETTRAELRPSCSQWRCSACKLRGSQDACQPIEHPVCHAWLVAGEEAVRNVEIFVDHDLGRRAIGH
jgi:hypothetical protein